LKTITKLSLHVSWSKAKTIRIGNSKMIHDTHN